MQYSQGRPIDHLHLSVRDLVNRGASNRLTGFGTIRLLINNENV
jgi:hypothetical protein